MISDQTVTELYEERYGETPEWIARAPGRVNIIGEHTDYNGGLVLPAAIDREMKVAASVRDDRKLMLYAGNFDKEVTVDISERIAPQPEEKWVNYLLAVFAQFKDRGIELPGMTIVIQSDVPLGSGLSSSAAYEVCIATLLNAVTESGIEKKELALLAQAAEHSDFVGVKCGIMDQFVATLGEAQRALMVDCHTLEYRLVPFYSSQASIVIVNTMKKRGLAESAYNQRRQECEDGLAKLREAAGKDYETLRHVPREDFDRFSGVLDPVIEKRVRHIVTENQRVRSVMHALRANNFSLVGEQLHASHDSLRRDYEVSCEELDRIVEIARSFPAVYGARMTGAGFGGCAIALVRPRSVDEFTEKVQSGYEETFGVVPEVYVSEPAQGATVQKL